ncbi:MAG TPA: alkaline phosphatase D family protein [Longimicrobium sp.]|nr:alkaline phosphatase D family protein [Longimicrobium sp.]
MPSIHRIAAALLLAAAACDSPADPPLGDPTFRMAFGSCRDEDLPQPIWTAVRATAPDVWLWLGDNIYGDTQDQALLRQKYALGKSHPEYTALRAEATVIGTWDDHDYGRNNAGAEFPARAASQQALLDFLDVPASSARRTRAGVYESYVMGTPGRQVKVILLDTRYHRALVGSNGTMLGEEQWAWLEAELRGSRAQVTLIGSSTQVVSEEHTREKWANFPAERERLFRLIADTGVRGVVFLSGDRHFAEISRLDDNPAGYPLYDVTSSGMTHSTLQAVPEPNRHRVGPGNVGVHNFTLLEIDWTARPVTLRFTVRDVENTVRMEHVIPLTELQP